ncbi:NADH-quinone oxidoreductase subunit NuoF [bacterium]|nr:NADH-quinone oxidoreductase subunit NuoF [bacterium]MBU1985199.1 NADH-quinone oxidoreductase subunit NuoF [bacterium]
MRQGNGGGDSVSPERLTSPEALNHLRERLLKQRDNSRTVINVCSGTGCLACGCSAVTAAFREALAESRLENVVELKTTGCHGFCERGPLVAVYPLGVFYQKVSPSDVKLIVDQTIKGGKLVNKLLYKDPQTKQVIPYEHEIPFYKKQMRLLLGLNMVMDPNSIEDYFILRGYQCMVRALFNMKPEEVVQEVLDSGLRGRGGAGFPTGKKWAACREAKAETKYIICNADEGDPGAFMDRSLLEGNPHSIIEGIVVGGYAVGAHQGFVYVRNEYPLAVKNLTYAIGTAREYGLLGRNILGSGFDFDIEVSRGGGAFVCGEETALIASIEGNIGTPRPRPPYPAEAGLFGLPTLINNVESWASVALIIEKGAKWFSSIGTASSKGTKVFALTGNINNTGLVEVPMGITLREIIYDIGGGCPRGKKFKAVQTGGPSGGTLIVESGEPEIHESLVAHGDIREEEEAISLLDLPVDFDELTKAGSMMGSGGMIVMDQDTCMVDMAKYFFNFLQEESCGKCLPCREGLQIILAVLKRIADGKGETKDLDTLEEVSQVMIDTSLCQLGGTAPNPVLSTLRYFRHEYLAHIQDKRCPAGVCKELVSHAIDETCTGCHVCFEPCPTDAITGKTKELHVIDQAKCIQCGACYQVCRFDSIKRVKRGGGDIVQLRAKEKWQPLKKRTAAVA